MVAPTLKPRDIQAKLEEIFVPGKTHAHHLVALYGQGLAEPIDTGTAGAFTVHPVASEFELRRALPPRHDPEDRRVFLVGWADAELPPDIAGRFARRGRILRIARDARLRRIFGGAEVEREVITSALGRYLATQEDIARLSVRGGRVGSHVAWNAWLAHAWDVDVSGGVALDSLLAWAARDGRGASFASAMAKPDAAGLKSALLEYLGRSDVLGPAGPWVWRAWEAGRGGVLLQFAVLLEALWRDGAAVDPIVEVWLSTVCGDSLGFDPGKEPAAVDALRTAVPGALRLLRQSAPQRVRELLRDAEARVTHDKVRARLVDSQVLPVAWSLRLQELGRHLVEAAVQPSVAQVERATTLLARLETHDRFKDDECTRDYQRAEMACRMLSFLAARPDQQLTITPAPESAAEVYGRWYADQGGYLDWARHWARGATADTDFGRGVGAVLAQVDAIRTTIDRAFARALPAWLAVKRSARHLLPIEQAVARTVVPFLEGKGGPEGPRDPRRVLVLLMDGMAWPQAVELLTSLGSEGSRPWSPIAFNGEVMARPTMHLPVVAMLPSITEVSRVAFFSGKSPEAGKNHRTTDDPKRWRDHRELKPFFPGIEAPQLLLKGDGFGRDGSAAPEALTLVRDTSQPAVALVINAIDDHLKASSQEERDWTIDRIGALRDLLDAAREAGRAVLLASDHGHVPGDRLTEFVPKVKEGGARWRRWQGEDDPIADYECAVPAELAWAPKGARGVVGLVDDTRCYRAQKHAGEHGGAALAEVMAPAVFIGWDGMNDGLAAHHDAALQLRPENKPSWWIFDVVVPDEARPAIPKPRKSKAKAKPEPENQLRLIPAPAAPSIDLPTDIVDRMALLRRNKALRELAGSEARRDAVLLAVQVLLERRGTASQDAFASATGVPGFRIPGHVSSLSEVLNVDGAPVLRYDRGAAQVRLNQAQLWQCFEE